MLRFTARLRRLRRRLFPTRTTVTARSPGQLRLVRGVQDQVVEDLADDLTAATGTLVTPRQAATLLRTHPNLHLAFEEAQACTPELLRASLALLPEPETPAESAPALRSA